MNPFNLTLNYTAAEAAQLMLESTYKQDKIDDVVSDVLFEIQHTAYALKNFVQVEHPVFACKIGEPIEILIRRAEVICALRNLGFKCEKTEDDEAKGTLTVSWATQ